jgi:hypothetical protein
MVFYLFLSFHRRGWPHGVAMAGMTVAGNLQATSEPEGHFRNWFRRWGGGVPLGNEHLVMLEVQGGTTGKQFASGGGDPPRCVTGSLSKNQCMTGDSSSARLAAAAQRPNSVA